MVMKNALITGIAGCHCLDLQQVNQQFCSFAPCADITTNNKTRKSVTLQTPTLCSKVVFCFSALHGVEEVFLGSLCFLTARLPVYLSPTSPTNPQHFLTSSNSVLCSTQQQLLLSLRWPCLIQTIQASPQPCYQQESPHRHLSPAVCRVPPLHFAIQQIPTSLSTPNSDHLSSQRNMPAVFCSDSSCMQAVATLPQAEQLSDYGSHLLSFLSFEDQFNTTVHHCLQ